MSADKIAKLMLAAPNFGYDTLEPSLRALINCYYRNYFPEEQAYALTDKYIAHIESIAEPEYCKDKVTELMRAVDSFAEQYHSDACGHFPEGGSRPARKRVESLAHNLAGPTQEDLRMLVDVVWQCCNLSIMNEGIADALIAQALGTKGKP